MKRLLRKITSKIGIQNYRMRNMKENCHTAYDYKAKLSSISYASLLLLLKEIRYCGDKLFLFECFEFNKEDSSYSLRELTDEQSSHLEKLMIRNSSFIELLSGPAKPVNPDYNKIHYACGDTLMQGWLNTDFGESDKKDYLKVNLADRHPFLDEVFDFAFSEDFLEHLNQSDSIIFLSEAYRTLKRGGC